MDHENMRVPELKALTRDHGLRGYSNSRLRKAKLIALIRNNPPPPAPAPRPTPALRPPSTRPSRPNRPPPPPLSVKFRPDRSRQPELLRKLEEGNP